MDDVLVRLVARRTAFNAELNFFEWRAGHEITFSRLHETEPTVAAGWRAVCSELCVDRQRISAALRADGGGREIFGTD